jgi:uncharacterized protein YxjI
MEKLLALDGLVISQKKEWGEIVTGFETKNKYAIFDTSGNELYNAIEEDGSTFMRWVLKSLRPFEININNYDNHLVLKVSRPFRFYFHQLNIFNSQGELIGTIQRQFSIFRRIYSVLDSLGNELFKIFGPLLHPWTFEIKKGVEQHGKIIKKWSGLLKEGFTDADNFGVTFPREWDKKIKALLLGAVFLIDFVHFENTSKRR